MQLLSVLFVASLTGVGIAVPAGILDKLCGPNYDADDCIDPNQIWGTVEAPTKTPQPTATVTPTAIATAKPPAVDPEEEVCEDDDDAAPPQATATPPVNPEDVCFDESEEVFEKCKADGKDNRACIAEGDKSLNDCKKRVKA
ncbi:hypothetical protein ISF_04505 [Cordyceps fumosorosea ARSEF 2679]|uniref:Uncharacterized protein n=1 Tax=Cordyceps fumosorosea (strain ARSEF 2679) TaxID=1081104 RepID=A0A167WHH1_CORFA|nr:hypothetical protein ISF_04505 [Cordyceps fumosorosea ARSEF 2679]OAA63796.1 hypothetical protein ISF_04505 [Cordyceps fumosorosea ARSEF 2679]